MTENPAQSAANPRLNLLAALLGPGVVYAALIALSFMQHTQEQATRPRAWFVLALAAAYLLVFAGWQYLVLRFLCRERMGSLNLRAASLLSDLQTGALVFVLLALANAAVDALFRSLGNETNAQTLSQSTLFMSQNGWLLVSSLLATWLTAGMEEITRAFLLSRLLRLSAAWAMKLLALVVAVALFGLVHVYQGAYGIVNASVLGLILAAAFIYNGRLRPLALAHGLFNSFLILYWVVTVHWNLWEF